MINHVVESSETSRESKTETDSRSLKKETEKNIQQYRKTEKKPPENRSLSINIKSILIDFQVAVLVRQQ